MGEKISGGLEAMFGSVPKTTPVGTSVLLMEVSEAVKFFPGRSHRSLLKIMEVLGVPFIRDHKKRTLFNLYTLEKILYYVTRPGGPGISLPGSTYRLKNWYDDIHNPGKKREDLPLFRIGKDDVKNMHSAILEAERLATGKKGTGMVTASYISTLRELERRNKTKKKEKGKTATS